MPKKTLSHPLSTKVVNAAFKFCHDKDLDALNATLLELITDSPSEETIYRTDDLINGVWSGMPLCCVFAYSYSNWFAAYANMYALTEFQYILPDSLNYVPCKTCIALKTFTDTVNPGQLRYIPELKKWIFGEWKSHNKFVQLDPVKYIN